MLALQEGMTIGVVRVCVVNVGMVNVCVVNVCVHYIHITEKIFPLFSD